MTLGEKIKFYRTHRGLTQKQLGDMTGIHEVSIRKYELDKITPKKEQLEKIATLLNIPYNSFLDLQIVTDADVISLLFAIEDSFEMDITSEDNNAFKIEFKHPMMKYILRDWLNAKQMLAEGVISEEQYSYWKATRPGYIKPIFDED